MLSVNPFIFQYKHEFQCAGLIQTGRYVTNDLYLYIGVLNSK
jgi:hypothetical protein